jgi:tetratricopeptide (TPR) repeat protein/polyferredoxin
MDVVMKDAVKPRDYAKWRVATLVGVHVLFIAHFIHWKLKGRTLAPLEFNEVLYTIHQGIVTAGFILMLVVMVATLVFGRFFCSWGCHILALQDAAGWILDKLRIKRQPIRSRTLIWVPIAVMFYLFIWPQLLQAWQGVEAGAVQVVEAGGSRWSSFTTDDLWRNLPPPGVAVLTFFVCGFVIVYLLGSRGFCFQACPYGALFSVADQFAPGRIVLTKDCSQCGLCTKACSSDILVHRELALHSMVTNPRCLKDLDCVTACPENAVQFGFRMPPLFRKGHPMGAYRGRFSNSRGEDLFLAFVFVFTMPIYRGLYDAVPFLLAVALSLCTGYVLLLGWHLLRRSAMQFRGLTLKMDRSLRPAGVVFTSAVLLLVIGVLHSTFVQYHTILGKRLFQRIALNATHTSVVPTELDRAIIHYEKALAIGILRPLDRRQELASLYLHRGDDRKASRLLEEIIEADPGHVEAMYRLAEIARRSGDHRQAMALWQEALDRGTERSGGRSRELLVRSSMDLGAACIAQGDLERARAAYAKGLARTPGEIPLLIALGGVESRTGQDRSAIAHFVEAQRLGDRSALLHNNLGALYLRNGRLPEALPHYQQLVALMPDDARARYALGVVLARTGRPEAARDQLVEARRLDPADERTANALALLNGPVHSDH